MSTDAEREVCELLLKLDAEDRLKVLKFMLALRDALEFYADSSNWMGEFEHWSKEPKPAEVIEDDGKRARMALFGKDEWPEEVRRQLASIRAENETLRLRCKNAENGYDEACKGRLGAILRWRKADALLRRIRQWDHLEGSGDGPYWRKEIDTLLAGGETQ